MGLFAISAAPFGPLQGKRLRHFPVWGDLDLTRHQIPLRFYFRAALSLMSLFSFPRPALVSDGINPTDTKNVTVQIIDAIAPSLTPEANIYMLWPQNHKMVNIAIAANEIDNSGLPITLNAAVTSNEHIEGLDIGDIGPDWTEPVIDQTSGMIYLQLGAERSGRGTGRIYTVTITAMDLLGNISTAKVNILVPHDKK